MKTKFLIIIAGAAMGLAMAWSVGCRKDQPMGPTSTTSDISAAQDDANATFAANDSKNISDAAMQSNGSSTPSRGLWRRIGDIFSPCVTVVGKDTSIGGNADTVLYISFGKEDCFCHDDRNRRGTIIVYWGLSHPGETWWQAYYDSANTITMTFRNYFLRDNGIIGTRTWTNEGHNVSGFENWNFTANLTIVYPDQKTATWISARNNTLIEVDSIWYFEITGSSHGVAKNGIDYTLVITSPVYFTALPWWRGGCPWPEAGVITITLVSNTTVSKTITENFGTLGTCSPQAFADIDGNRYKFDMW